MISTCEVIHDARSTYLPPVFSWTPERWLWSFVTATIISGVAPHVALAFSKTSQATPASIGARLLFPTTARKVRGQAPKSLTTP